MEQDSNQTGNGGGGGGGVPQTKKGGESDGCGTWGAG